MNNLTYEITQFQSAILGAAKVHWDGVEGTCY